MLAGRMAPAAPVATPWPPPTMSRPSPLVGRNQWNVSAIVYLSAIPTFSIGLIYMNPALAAGTGEWGFRWDLAIFASRTPRRIIAAMKVREMRKLVQLRGVTL